ncbi:hypothetical protein OAS95_00640 [Pelagibacteraceae bacterium]|jgi:hypothetical protein|nr:hypothetical protein [Pelagibacteraceae bacterium]
MLDKFKNLTINKTKSAKDFTVKKWKKLIKRQAIKRVEKNLRYLQKKPSDYSYDEMRELIAEEEKEIIANLKIAGGMGAIMTLLGIPKIF